MYTEDNKLIINMWTAQDSQVIKDILSNFNASQDKYEVVMSFKGSYPETLTAGIAATKAGQPPHILQVFEVGTGTMMSAEEIYKPADDILSQYGGVEVDSFRFIPGIQSYYSKNGKLQSLPFNSSTPVALYNKDAFRKAGLNPNQMPATFEELETVLVKLKDAGYVPLASDWGSYVFIETLSSIHNKEFATQNNGLENPNAARMALSDLHLKTFEYIKDWSDKGLYKYYGRDGSGSKPFVQQEAAILFGSSASQNNVKVSGGFDYGIAPIPYFSSITSNLNNSMVGGASLWVFDGFSDDVYSGIAEFMKYVYSPQVMFEYHDVTGYLPLTAGAYEVGTANGYYKENPEAEIPYLQFTRPSGEHSQGWRLGNFVQIRTAYEETLEALLQGEITPAQAMEVYTAKADKLLQDFENAN